MMASKDDIRAATGEEADELAAVIRAAYATVAARFHLNADNCPKHPSNCTGAWVRRDFDRGVSYLVMEHTDGGAMDTAGGAPERTSGGAVEARSAGAMKDTSAGIMDKTGSALESTRAEAMNGADAGVLESPDADIIGCVAVERADERACYLERLAVLPQYRRSGRGRALVHAALEKARAMGADRVDIGLIDAQAELKAWYERFGFVQTGTRAFDHLPFTVAFMRCRLDS